MRRVALLLVALVVAGCGGSGGGEAVETGPEPHLRLTDVTGVDVLEERFNADRGVPRLIVLVAPT